MFQVIKSGPLAVTLDTLTGEVVAVRDALTGCAASLMYPKGQIAQAVAFAQRAWASTIEAV